MQLSDPVIRVYILDFIYSQHFLLIIPSSCIFLKDTSNFGQLLSSLKLDEVFKVSGHSDTSESPDGSIGRFHQLLPGSGVTDDSRIQDAIKVHF